MEEYGTNPIIRNIYTADPAPMVCGDTLYLYLQQGRVHQPGAQERLGAGSRTGVRHAAFL